MLESNFEKFGNVAKRYLNKGIKNMIETIQMAASASDFVNSFGPSAGFSLFWAICAIGGGIIGAAIGGNWAFVMTGFSVFLGFAVAASTGSDIVLNYMAFGPVFGPHICFAGGAAAHAYAGKLGLNGEKKGKDIDTSPAGFGNPTMLWIGAIFGLGGYLLERCIRLIPWFGHNTDTVALTVLISGLLVRLIFGKTGIFNWTSQLTDKECWLRWQEKPSQWITIGIGASIFAGGLTLTVAHLLPYLSPEIEKALLGNAQALPFGISAITILMLILGFKIPVTHHITITAGLAAMVWFPILGNSLFLALLASVVFGLMAAGLAEFSQRLMYARGDTHIDPPAASIWISHTIVRGLGLLVMAAMA